jgi:hypothetical protein
MAIVAVLWWALTPREELPSSLEMIPVPAASTGPAQSARYVGAASCRECHPGECAAFSRSGHARTLRPAEKDPIARWLDGKTVADPERPKVSWSYHLRDGRLSVDRSEGGKVETLPIEFSFGSGQVGTTFVTTMKSAPDALPVGVEHRLSYMAVGKKLAITPGQQAGAFAGPGTRITPSGRLLDQPRLVECFFCHVTATSTRRRGQLDTATMIPNVSCEQCHGPAGDHVEAARRGTTGEEMRLAMGPDQSSPSAEVESCAVCHRSIEATSADAIEPENLAIVRFQPVGLSRSKCFQGGASGLRCTSCHDAHARVSHDTASYEAVCLDCHQPRSEGRRPSVCPISPARDCLSCHMPRRQVTPEFAFTDHWIRVRSEQKTAAAPTHAAAGRGP